MVARTGGHCEKTTKSHWKGRSEGKNGHNMGNEKEQETPSDGAKYPRKIKFSTIVLEFQLVEFEGEFFISLGENCPR